MKVQELPNASHLRPQKLSGQATPHVTIETNTTCNIRCKFCYAIEHPMQKTLDEIRAEIDRASELRDLDAVSLLGGEPTLHPDIVEIVRYVKSKGLVCQVLTNGVRFLYQGDVALLDRLIEAGVDRFLVHLDSGQAHVHGDVEAARHRLFELLDGRGVWYGLSLTLYAGEEDQLPRIMREYARYRFFDGVLVTLAFDFDRAFQAPERRRFEPDLGRIAAAIQADLAVEPAAYIPSNLDDDEVCWLMYFYWINTETGQTFGLSPEFNRVTKLMYRTLAGHEFFADTMQPGTLGVQLAATGAAEILMHPSRTGQLARLLRDSHATQNLRFHYIVIQQAPRMNQEHGRIQFCWKCPDATMRDGRLVPVCMAGRLAPLAGGEPTAPDAVIADVFAHLDDPGDR